MFGIENDRVNRQTFPNPQYFCFTDSLAEHFHLSKQILLILQYVT